MKNFKKFTLQAIFQNDKESREQDLIARAANLFAKQELSDIGIIDICKEAGLAKGTFYLYFDSKEEIFLRLTQDLLIKWAAEMNSALRELPAGAPTTAFARTYTRLLENYALLLRLLTLLHAVIEKNVAVDAIRPFKRKLAEIQNIQVSEFHRIFPPLK